MNTQQIREAIKHGRNVYGTMIVSPSPNWLGVLNDSMLDFVFIDTEHAPLDRQQLSWMCRAYAAANLAPIVRIPSPDPIAACQVLDGGAAGIIAPYVETPEQVRALRGAVKLRPLKGQRLADALDGKPLEPEVRSYLDAANAGKLLFVNIESTPALENLDSILAVPGLDGILLGPHDLSISLGVPEQYDHPAFDEALQMMIDKARAAGLIAAAHFVHGPVERSVKWTKMGVNMLIQRADIVFLANGLAAELNAIRHATGDAGGGRATINI